MNHAISKILLFLNSKEIKVKLGDYESQDWNQTSVMDRTCSPNGPLFQFYPLTLFYRIGFLMNERNYTLNQEQ